MNESSETRKINLVFVGVVYFLLFSLAVWIDRHQYVFRFPLINEKLPLTLFKDLSIGLGAGLLVVWLTAVAIRWKKGWRDLALEFRELLEPLKTHEIFFVAAFSAISEEFFFRGLVQAKVGLVIASLLFGLLHIGPDRKYIPWTIFAVVLGFVMGGLYIWTDNLLVPVVMHFTINFLNLRAMEKWKPSDPENPSV